MEVALGHSEMAWVSSAVVEPDRREERVVTVGDEPVELRFERVGAGRGGGARTEPETIELWARVGHEGDVGRERRLLSRLVRRLEQLAGRDWAPR
jgi:hypothetical protein